MLAVGGIHEKITAANVTLFPACCYPGMSGAITAVSRTCEKRIYRAFCQPLPRSRPAGVQLNQALLPVHVARLYGEPLLELPHDLYIPPDALEVFLDTFEGPLDLLLYLIRKHNLDVLDIPMAKLTLQYMTYVEAMQVNQLELAAEYLLMAALLIEIKSRMLLPRPPTAIADEADPRAELVRRLLEYEQMKAAAQRLDELPQAGRDFAMVQVWIEQAYTKRLPEISPDDLKSAWLGLLVRASVNQHHKVGREELSVRAHMSRILRQLQGSEFFEFTALFNIAAGIAELVVTLLAILELARESLVEITQQEAYAPIYVKRAEQNG